ncbi:MAG TPA: RluA family pseudouridine synthase, partial [Polyangiaceae bacterium]
MTRVRGSSTRPPRPEGVEEGAVVTILRVPPEVAGQRLDVFVQSQLKRTSRTRAQAIVRASAYDGDGRKLVPNDRVRPEQQVLLWRAAWDETPVPTVVPV